MLCNAVRSSTLRRMATTIVYDTIKAKLVTDLGGTYAIRDWEEIDNDLAQMTDPFLAIEESIDATELASIGTPDANWIKDTGTLDVHIFVPSNGSLSVARTIADAVRTSLGFQTFSMNGASGLRAVNVDAPVPGVIADGLWHSMQVAVDFEHTHAVATA